MQKDQLAKIAGLDTDKIDYAIPQSLFNLMVDNQIPHNLVAYSYEKKPYGELINLGEEFIFNAQDNIKIDIYRLFKVMEEYHKKMVPYEGEPFYISLMDLILWLSSNIFDRDLLEYRNKKD